MAKDEDDFEEEHTQSAVRIPITTNFQNTEKAYLVVLAGNNVGETVQVKPVMTIGRTADNDFRVIDDGVSRKHARLLIQANRIVIEDLGSRNGTFVNGQKISSHELHDGDKIEVGSTTILKFTFHDKLEQEFQQKMFDAALKDGLTKAFNKRYFDDRLKAEFSFATRHQTPLSLLLFDIDHFKRVNDTFGHAGGDYVLVTLANQMRNTIRKEDIFARVGGEEFALLCRATTGEFAEAFANRLRGFIEATAFVFNGQRIPVTTSVGVAALPHDEATDHEAFFRLADKALYDAKNLGRNRVVFSRSR